NRKVSIWPCWASTVATAEAAANWHPVTTLAPARLPIVRHRDQHRCPCCISLAGDGTKQPIVGPMNFDHDRAFNRRIVVGAGQGDHLCFSGERVDYHTLKFGRNDLVVFGEKKNNGSMNSLRVGNAMEFVGNLQGDRSGQEPKIPPAVTTQDYLAQWWRIVENEPADFPIGRNVHCHGASNARAKNEDRLVRGLRFQCIEGGKGGGRHSFQTCWAGAATEARIIHSPNFDGAFVECVGFKCNPSFRAIGVAVETQNVGIYMIALLREPRTRRPDFEV